METHSTDIPKNKKMNTLCFRISKRKMQSNLFEDLLKPLQKKLSEVLSHL